MEKRDLQRIDEGVISSSEKSPISDKVIIEIIHAFKEIIIEYINKKYS